MEPWYPSHRYRTRIIVPLFKAGRLTSPRGDLRMCYNHRTADDERRKETEDRLKRMIRDRSPSNDTDDDDDGGLIVLDIDEKDDKSRRKPELA